MTLSEFAKILEANYSADSHVHVGQQLWQQFERELGRGIAEIILAVRSPMPPTMQLTATSWSPGRASSYVEKRVKCSQLIPGDYWKWEGEMNEAARPGAAPGALGAATLQRQLEVLESLRSYVAERAAPRCDCGAAHTSFPDSHSSWCSLAGGRDG